MFTESRFLEILNSLTGRSPVGVAIGIGDDAAVFDDPDGLVVAADMILDGVDFVLAECGYHAAAIKAVRKNVSDLAAMGARPTSIFAGVALPAAIDEIQARALLVGLTGEARRLGCPIVGGDTKRSSGPLILALTVLGKMEGRRPVSRGAAVAGDLLFVTGPLGGASAGRHLTPPIRVEVGIALAEQGAVHAMIDLSDGLSQDLAKLCAASGVGAVIEADRVPVHNDVLGLVGSRVGQSADPALDPAALDHALHDGEDFELLFAMPAHAAGRLDELPPVVDHCHLIGRIVAVEQGLTLERDGLREPLKRGGFEHRFGDPSTGRGLDR